MEKQQDSINQKEILGGENERNLSRVAEEFDLKLPFEFGLKPSNLVFAHQHIFQPVF